jgi:hypothetical protein
MSHTEFPVYFDPEKGQMYYIVWYDTGNNDIPTRHYISVENKQN